MTPDDAARFRALSARDPRFDGVFFVGVTTTGIYCRPVCPARLPRRDRCRFFEHPGAAEAAGFRPCLRCRPERAPGRAIVDASRRLAERAAARIGAGALNEGGVEDLAAELHVGPRQLRRALKREYGAGPTRLAQTHRLLLAKRLLTETDLPVSRVAFASGFSSVRRFNALFRERYRMAPGALRPDGATPGRAPAASLTLTLEYRPPYAWDALLRFLEARTVPGLEAVELAGRDGGRYLRTVTLGDHRGWFAARPAPSGDAALEVEVSLSLLPALMCLLTRLRSLFDLDAEPAVIDGHLLGDPVLRPLVHRRPGLRVPGAGDAFELVWRAVLGQQVSVAAARTLAGRFAEAFGDEAPASAGLPRGLTRFPVRPERVARAGPERIAPVGIPRARAECLSALARLVADGAVSLEPGTDVTAAMTRLREVRGIGPWTAEYIALRALHWPDAFPEGDLGLRKALAGATGKATGDLPPAAVRRISEAWRPWRAYAAIHLWEGATHDTTEDPP